MFKAFAKMILSFTLVSALTISSVSAASKSVKIKITYVNAELVENNHVGNEWATSGIINNKEILEGDSIILDMKSTDSIKIKAKASELDKIPDSGSGSTSIKVSAITKKTTKTLKVTVKENRGRYSGNTAEWKFIFEISKL
ncbi:hypothetical protein [Cohnella panacarvi]|uniref:hypothetical protein n=1 Tax=Cohnella panacarvi TaxID=400776 RepID=UPI00047B3CE8|nr:hypothetical protein [Cohnella panacarvi]